MTSTLPPTRPRRRTALARIAIGLAAVTSLGTVAGASLASASDGHDNNRKNRTLEVDVAENGTRFVIDETPVFDDGFPAYGNPFLTQGYIYPAGTLNGSNGVNPDGSPEFPDKVIGEWSCSGYFIADGAHTTEGSWVYSTQLFAFGADADTGAETVVVTGYEGAEVGEIVTGAITGGTGAYVTARRGRPGTARDEQPRAADDGREQDRHARVRTSVASSDEFRRAAPSNWS